ncbi:hypothetical protein BX600DRAFT_381900 [Xylariales sp. PMI_506]|nr:hypothetical protein BX600DRAFT_381900 [Xylariales sp. PMI_506]
MEGVLVIPPDRGTIIGRALWKPRYVVVGSPYKEDFSALPNLGLSQTLSAPRGKEGRGLSTKLPHGLSPDAVYLSIYKSKDEWEAVQQHSMASITDCSIQMLAHRKQGPVLPTLVLQISPDPATDKLRKRRSSRTAGLTTTKESGPTTLMFRPGDDQYSLQDWARCIMSLIQPVVPDRMPISPISPTSPTFINPFSPRSAGEFSQRPTSGKQDSTRPSVQPSQSSHSQSSRDRPGNFSSENLSLRSRRSDLSSSQASSSINMVGMGYVMHNQHYSSILPGDLPSPATTLGEYQGEYMLGWTSAQGRSSTLSSPIRGRGSVGSQGGQQGGSAGAPISSSPPAPRETILDRAFQLRCIPGSEREVPGEEKLSSLARFEALMRETDDRRRREKQEAQSAPKPMSTWEEDEDSDDDDLNDSVDEDTSTDDDVFEEEVTGDKMTIGPSAQRALHYITNRHSLTQASTITSSEAGASLTRPHTAHSKSRPTMTPRTSSQPQFPLSALDIPSRVPEDTGSSTRPCEKRHSISSVKRLSFNEFTKRLSSTSSLLLVQTNTSNGSSRGSCEIDSQQLTPRTGLNARGQARSSQDTEKCGWRGSVGVFGAAESGLL